MTERGIRAGADDIREEFIACEDECRRVAGHNTYYWTGALDALAWVLGEGDPPSSIFMSVDGDD